MIRMVQSKSAGQAKAYFSDALAKSDYYISDQELAGVWQGKLATRLGLHGVVEKVAFFALCENRQPGTNNHLTPRTKEDRRTGYDINFHCPKSVSLMHVLSGNQDILKAFQNSVTDTMIKIERDAKTRVRKDGQQDDRNTGELVWAQFVHQTARPVEGHSPDPHLHAHCFTFNATWDDAEQRIKAGQFADIKRDMPYYQALFHKTLSDRLMNMGYAIRKTDKSFEIADVPQAAIDLFSKRTDEIGRIAKEKGITDAKELGELGARTRAKKQKGTSMEELKTGWREQINGLGMVDKDKNPAVYVTEYDGMLTPQSCIDHALLHGFERASVLQDRRILETAFHHAIGNSDVKASEITQSLSDDARIVRVMEKGKTMCTTKEVLSEEKHMVDLAKKGQGNMIPLYMKAPAISLNGQQAVAVEHILTTGNRVSIVRGAAGTGKTTLMKEAVSLIEQAGKTVTVVAPSTQASRGVLKDEGFENAETVARLLVDTKMQQATKGQVIWVDEAGLLGTKDMLSLLQIADKNNARLILGGDTRQHSSVIRGDALRILNTVAGIRSAEVSKIYRQKNEDYKTAIEHLSKGNVKEGFDKLESMDAIKEIDPMKPNEKLVKEYVETVKQGKTALVISPTHKQGDAVTDDIRNELRKQRMIGKKEIEVRKLTSLNMTEAEKKDIKSFQKGWIVMFNLNAPGFKSGSQWTVDSTAGKTVRIKNENGDIKRLPTEHSNRYDVMVERTIGLSKGDKIRMTREVYDQNNKRMNNGQMLDVVSVSKNGQVKLKSATGTVYKLDRSIGHIAHAHVITSHASQGKTVDEVFISQPAATFAATDAKQFYVSVSRGKERAHIFTDDKEALLQAATDMGDRKSALELVERRSKAKDLVINKAAKEYSKFLDSETNRKLNKRKDYEPEI